MTAKQFFKSNVFKCLITLLCVLLISGLFLTIMNGLLSVSKGQQLQSAVSKIYPGQSIKIYGLDDSGKEILIDDKVQEPKGYVSAPLKMGDAEIQEVYKIVLTNGDNDYLITSKGGGGFGEGTVTCRIAVTVKNGAITGIRKVSIEENEGQSYIDRVKENALKQFSDLYKEDIIYSPSVITNATVEKTKNAICNSVNGALDYVREKVLGNVWVDPYEKFALTEYIDTKQTAHEVKTDGSVEYHIVTKGYGDAGAFIIDITVKDGAVTDYKIAENGNGSTSGYEEFMPPKILSGEMFTGKNLKFFTDIYGENMEYRGLTSYDDDSVTVTTGASNSEYASNSTYICMYAGAFATANWQKCIDAANAEPPAENGTGSETTPEGGATNE